LAGATEYAVMVGGGTGGQNFHQIGPGTALWPLVSGGLGVDPLYEVLKPGGGGTGLASIPVGALVVGNDISTMTAVSPGAAGTVLMSNGTSSDPSFQDISFPNNSSTSGTAGPDTSVSYAGSAITTATGGTLVFGVISVLATGAGDAVQIQLLRNGSPIGPVFNTFANTTTLNAAGSITYLDYTSAGATNTYSIRATNLSLENVEIQAGGASIGAFAFPV
jgi:hypothetical protein